MKEHRLPERLRSLKHYFLLDQGDFFLHFLDVAEADLALPKARPDSQILRS